MAFEVGDAFISLSGSRLLIIIKTKLSQQGDLVYQLRYESGNNSTLWFYEEDFEDDLYLGKLSNLEMMLYGL